MKLKKKLTISNLEWKNPAVGWDKGLRGLNICVRYKKNKGLTGVVGIFIHEDDIKAWIRRDFEKINLNKNV